MIKVKNICSLVLLTVVLSQNVFGQTATLFRPRTLYAGARALGFADAFVADIHNVNSMYWNPASLVYLQNTSVVINHGLDRTSNIMNENIASPLFVNKGEVVAIGLTLNHIGYLEKSPLSDFKVMQYGYDVAYSREVTPTFCLGAGIGVRYGSSASTNLWAISSTVALFYAPSQEVSYGAVLSGIGDGIRYTFDGTSTILSSQPLTRSLQVGVTLRFPSSAKRTFLTMSFANEKIFDQEGLRYKGGVEYVALRLVALRIGYLVDPEIKVATYGLGLRAGKWEVDFGMLPSRLADRLYQFTLSFELWGPSESIRTDR